MKSKGVHKVRIFIDVGIVDGSSGGINIEKAIKLSRSISQKSSVLITGGIVSKENIIENIRLSRVNASCV